ncbi:hypothetical protein THRCLA_04728 [Thraustotheca clavata]|uniref:AB hydrolase-1 domain-containing protein n=1 Tax=Thraustotheca clavata TaxID=74557 RepID=A0A1V9ZY37_9STRA|nr:hypothetical protein THRCLA_04728 [Thraustotheca clavata]
MMLRRLTLHVRRLSTATQSLRLSNGQSIHFHRSTPPESVIKAPTLVFFHGLGASHQSFKYIAARLANTYPIIAFDMPGSGDSPASAAGSEYNAHTVDQALMDAIENMCEATTPRVYVGHSLGGHAALRITSNHLKKYNGQTVQGLVLLATAALKPYRVMQPFVSIPPQITGLIPTPFMAKVFHKIGFSDQHADIEYKNGVMRLVTTDWQVLRDAADTIAMKKLQCLCISAKDDPFLYFKYWDELCHAVGNDQDIKIISYDHGAHNIPKTRQFACSWVEQSMRLSNGQLIHFHRLTPPDIYITNCRLGVGNEYTAHTVDRALMEAIESICEDSTPRVYVGHSLGGYAALRITANHLKNMTTKLSKGCVTGNYSFKAGTMSCSDLYRTHQYSQL